MISLPADERLLAQHQRRQLVLGKEPEDAADGLARGAGAAPDDGARVDNVVDAEEVGPGGRRDVWPLHQGSQLATHNVNRKTLDWSFVSLLLLRAWLRCLRVLRHEPGHLRRVGRAVQPRSTHEAVTRAESPGNTRVGRRPLGLEAECAVRAPRLHLTSRERRQQRQVRIAQERQLGLRRPGGRRHHRRRRRRRHRWRAAL